MNHKTTDSYGKYQILGSKFIDVNAVTGGAIYIDNPQYLTIKDSIFNLGYVRYNSSVSNVKIAGSGGALYYTCDSTN